MFSKILRRTHMYLALFLSPWILMYALSTLVMNHKPRPGAPPRWERVDERTYDGVFPPGATHQMVAKQVLASLDLDGAHQARQEKDGRIIIQRAAAVEPLRLTFTPASKNLLIEKQTFAATPFLERMHRRRGFQHPYALDDIWAFSVDLFIAGVLFWTLSGLWLWWELKVTRWLGAAALAGGLALFGFLVVML